MKRFARILCLLLAACLGVPGGAGEPESTAPTGAAAAVDDAYLGQLARIQESNGELDLSRDSYTTLIEHIRDREGEYSTTLIDPLIGLGRVCLAQGDHAGAEDALRRAQHLTHRESGVHAADQLPIIDLMTRVEMARDEPLEADREQRFALYISEHLYGTDALELLPALAKLADWYLATGQFMRAHWSYKRALEIAEAQSGANALQLVEPLRGIARALQLDGSTRTYESLERARDIVENAEGVDPVLYVQVLAELGDAYTVGQKSEEAKASYRKAWTRLQASGLGAVEGVDFAQPSLIELSRPLRSLGPMRRTLVLDSDPLLGTQYTLREQTEDEADLSSTQAPRTFTAIARGDHYRYRLRDVNDQAAPDPKDRVVIGNPIQFMLQPVLFLMPVAYQRAEKLAEVVIRVEFNVDPVGDATDITIVESNAPGKLEQLLREALAKSWFRPRVVDGEPVATEKVQILQEFR